MPSKMLFSLKTLTVLLGFSFFVVSCSENLDQEALSRTVKEQAGIMGQMLIKKDFNGFVKFSYPKIIQAAGGEQQMVQAMEKGAADMEAKGFGFSSMSFGEPSEVVKEGEELQCTLPAIVEMKGPTGTRQGTSTLIATSPDNGKSWYFIDTNGKDLEKMKRTLPNLSDDLEIPEQEAR